MAAKLSARGVGNPGFPAETVASKLERDELLKIQQDINVITQRIADLRGEPVSVSSNDLVPQGSSFVTGIRNMTDSERKGKGGGNSKANALETLLEKVAEFDRLVLQRTVPEPNANGVVVRRKSVGLDLHLMPTHLHVTDRLMDLHTQSKRVVVLKTTGQPSAAVDTASNAPALPQDSASDKKLLEVLRAQVTKLTKQNEDSESQRLKYVQDCLQLAKENTELKEKLSKMEVKTQQQPQPQTVPVVSSASVISSKEYADLQDKLTKLQQKSAADQQQLTQQNTEMKEKLVKAEQKIAELTSALQSATSAITTASTSVIDNSEEIANLKARIRMLEDVVQDLQIQVELEKGKYESIKQVVFGKTQRWTSRKETGLTVEAANAQDCFNLPEDMRNAFFALECALNGRIETFRNEIALLLSVKEMLEGELSSVNLQRDMLHTDHNTLSSEHEALKIAYHELSYETASGNKAKTEKDSSINLQNQLKDANNTIEQLQNELYLQKRQIIDLEKLPLQVMKLEQGLNSVQEEKSKCEATIVGQNEEIKQYKKLTDTLKDKIKELGLKSSSGGQETKDFLDTFEEVMRDEMLTMKNAFEAKLKAAKDTAEATSKRHQQEIIRIHAGTPYANKLNKLN